MAGRTMVKLIHADDFFPNDDVTNLRNAVVNSNFIEKPYGREIDNFNIIYPDIETIFHRVLGERVIVDPYRSGVIRKPYNNAIHFEHYNSPDEWCFLIALERTTINLWHHIDPTNKMGDLEKATTTDALMGVDYNYKNLFEWKIHTNILLEPNQAIFMRPWLFHSLESGLVQYYRLIADAKYRVLVMGLPNSSKKSVSEKLTSKLNNSVLLNSMDYRTKHRDIDFTENGQLRHCHRMLKYARASDATVTVINMTTPLPKMREILNPDFLIWVADGDIAEYKELQDMYTPPVVYDYKCDGDNDEEIDNIIQRIITKRI
jgi:hypothetical protein